jgi:succinyl-CoA synthetase beta subunit
MKIHEYQAKQLLRQFGAPVPRGILLTQAEEASRAFADLGGQRAVLKAQIHAGGRGKGRFAGSGTDLGGVRIVASAEEARQVAEVMLSYPLVTKQTGPQGQRVSRLLMEEALPIAREFYAGLVIDRSQQLPVLMVSAEGGVEIEEVAARNPEAILKTAIDPDRGFLPYQARRLGYDLNLDPPQVEQLEQILRALVRLFLEYDASLAEINPLVLTAGGSLLALDAKVNFDDNALFRHPDLEQLRDLAEENPSEVRAARAGLSYVSMNGNIGCLVNGAGLAMSTMDIIKLHGGEPANFLDVGGGANKDQVTEALRILLADPRVRAVLVNIFGGIMKCDTIAAAILAAFQEVQPKVPFVVRLEGTNVELGRAMLANSGLKIITASDLTDAARKVVAAAQAG